MPAITSSFMMDLETRMQVISSNAYDNLTRDLWWTKIAKKVTMTARKERFLWLLDTAQIKRTGRNGGNLEYEDIVSQQSELEVENAADGLKLKKEQLADSDGNGMDLAGHWARGVGAYASYWPQQCVADAIKANLPCYDGQPFFSTAHPVNPYDTQLGTFANIFTGSASGPYPGKVPIDASVSLEVAIQNLSKVIGYVAGMKMPNGKTPRMMRLAHLFVPPLLMPRAVQLTGAKFIATVAGSGAATTDVEALIGSMGLGTPIVLTELGSAFGGSDVDYYVGMEDITNDQLGAFLYGEREPFSVGFYGPQTDVELARTRVFEWLTEGRNNVGAGHPFLLFKCCGT